MAARALLPPSRSESTFSTLAENIDESIAVLVNEDAKAEDAFRIIDQEVDKYKTYIVALLKRRNTFAPISRLPPEVLCSIFHFMVIVSDEVTANGAPKWITEVSHVSHAWRNIAVNTPSLWTELPLFNSQWTKEMLFRSKVASLSVDAMFNRYRAPGLVNTLSSVLRHASRIRHLHIWDVPFTSMQKILSDFPNSTPRLESLCLRGIHDEPVFFQDEALDSELPAESLCDAGRLSKLELTRCKINWDTHLFSSLTSLSIQDTASSSRPTTAQFWDALKRMPHLEHLDLQDALPVIDEATRFSSYEPIHFEHLQQLTLRASSPQVEFFLKGISYLPTVITKVTCQATTTSGSEFSGPLSAVSSLISPSAKSGGLDISKFVLFDAFSFRAYSNSANDIANLEFVPKVSFARDESLKNVFAAMPLGNLTELHLSTASRFSPEALAETFGTLPHLRSVHTTNSCAQNFLDALQTVQPNANESAAQSVYFSNLRSVSMYGIRFDEGITVRMLQDALIWRYEIGAEVQELKLDMCSHITDKEVGRLRHIVVDVEWDEEELGFTASSEDSEDYDHDSEDYHYHHDHYEPDSDDEYGDPYDLEYW